jgi:cation diffusion facilitator CzcD-associated flavoprotein CzcO
MLTVRNSNWKWPEVDGLDAFQGTLIHTAQWPKDFDHTGKTVAVIGNGSSGIQVLPALQPGKHPQRLASHQQHLTAYRG